MGKRVAIEFQYFEICCLDDVKKTEFKYDFQRWISKMVNEINTLDARIKEIGSIKGRLETIRMVLNDEFYVLNFMRMEEISNTYIVKESERAQHIDLEEDEYIGRNTVVLYDPRLNIAMIQRNRGGYGVPAIESYVNAFNDPNDLCYFWPVNDEFKYNGQSGSFLKLEVRFANIRNFRAYNSKAFERVIDACNDLECITAHLEVGLGYSKGEELNAETIQEAIMDIRDPRNKETISTAKIKYTDDQKAEIFDLFDNLVYDVMYFTVPSRGELTFTEMAERMAKQYDERSRARILNILRSEEN